MSGRCTCPYGEICNHIVAVLLYAINEKGNIESATHKTNETTVKKHLQSLPREKLIDLVMMYAPFGFYTEVSNSRKPF